MELRYRREVSVGVMLVVGTLSFLALMMWLRGKTLGHAEIVPVSFDDVMGLKEGDPVRTSGVRIGRVKQIHLDSPGHVTVYLDISRDQRPHADAKARILSSDFFGARYIEFNPGTAAGFLADQAVIPGGRMQDMGEIADALSKKGNSLLDTVSATAAMVNRELRSTLHSTQTLLTTLNSGASVSTDRLVGALEDLRHVLQRVDQLAATNGPVATQAISGMRDATVHADSLTRTMQHASAQLDSILAKVNGGHGAVAAMLNDSTVMRNLMSTNEALRALLTDFKANPGRYIHVHVF
ncbi:MAG TPA: MlaD family protein [Gemmatimonadales bacterium]|jgi:phospholipid/cholesterol/gamma-HCH transport system substrate-binding protein